ncbi:MAG: hypothetical protein LBM04_04620 [Opitutaceae bacterium]|jgi:hypothetical protein|nr:hypothetical protein [Opitutaceae bacterium]
MPTESAQPDGAAQPAQSSGVAQPAEAAQPDISAQPAQPAGDGPGTKFATPRALIIDAILVIAFFAFMFSVIRPHVQTENPLFIVLWGGGTAACMAGIFWLALQMFRVVLRAQRAGAHAQKQDMPGRQFRE